MICEGVKPGDRCHLVERKAHVSYTCHNICNFLLLIVPEKQQIISTVRGIINCPTVDVGTASEANGELDPKIGQRLRNRGVGFAGAVGLRSRAAFRIKLQIFRIALQGGP